MDILLNQIGFLPGSIKNVTFRGQAMGDRFSVIDQATGMSVFEGEQSTQFHNKGTDEECRTGDISELKKPGTYYILAGKEQSGVFQIKEDVYENINYDLIYMLHLQRCGCVLSKQEAGEFAHPACHMGKAKIYGTDEEIEVSGGWHDAGDYGRYVVPAAKTITDILLAYELDPKSLSFSMNLKDEPFFGMASAGAFCRENYGEEAAKEWESLPDVLKELLYEVIWMMKMQRGDGAVYHKVTCESFCEMDEFPEEETEQLIVCPVSNAAAACYAATMAMIYRNYVSFMPSFAKDALAAGEKAFAYVCAHPDEIGFTNPEGIHTGEYRDPNWKDEWLWAASVLYEVTGKKEYEEVVRKLADTQLTEGLGWEETGFYGALFYVMNKNADQELSKQMIRKMVDYADRYASAAMEDAYGTASVSHHYIWGSNSIIANRGMLFMLLCELPQVDEEKKKLYQKAAAWQADYLLGRNGTGYCFVTGHGTLCPEHPHHRPSVKLKKAMKGMLVGGPDDNLQDECAVENLTGKASALCYIDDEMSYSTNEITIYWNTPLVYLLIALKKKDSFKAFLKGIYA
ncbi:MAG: glycoside hydrolase family 9 protein [Lachnospiraceae bacterium]|nr:glycoside hydrolase family 9 protein [Lachnospiraceae bacterium]